MPITFDPAKRAITLRQRGLDFADAGAVFAGQTATRADDRRDYGATRLITAGFLRDRFVVLVWTPRGNTRHIISTKHGHGHEEGNWRDAMG